MESAIIWHFLPEWFSSFSIASRSSNNVNRCLWVCVWKLSWSIFHGVVIEWKEPFIAVLVSPDFNVNTVIVKEFFQSDLFVVRETNTNSIFSNCAIVAVLIAAVHWSVTIGNDPWTKCSKNAMKIQFNHSLISRFVEPKLFVALFEAALLPILWFSCFN